MDSTTTTPTPWEGGEWELCNDDGFVYKRRKRHTLEPQPDRSDDELVANSTDMKRKALVRLRDQYRTEIQQWEFLSNALRDMEENAIHLRPSPSSASSSSLDDSPPSIRAMEMNSVGGSVVDELLLQIEAQEAIIRDASTLCDIVEAMCDSQEEEEYLSLIDLPIWALPASPRKLLASLCDQ